MDMKYRIGLLMQILPFGIIAGLIGIVATITAAALKGGKTNITHTVLTKKAILAFSVAFYFTYTLGISFFHSSRVSSFSISFPFAHLAEALINRSSYLLFNVLINVIAFMPFGCLVPLLWRRINNYQRIVSISLLCSCCIESIQLITRRGSFSCDDVIGNVIGAMIGFGAMKMVQRYRNSSVSFIEADTKQGRHLYIVILSLTFLVFVSGFLYCAVNNTSDNVYSSRVEKIFHENKKVLLDYTQSKDYSVFPNIKSIRDMAHSDDWFRLELGRSFNGTDLVYYGLFYLRDFSKLQSNIINEENIDHIAESCSYDADDGTHYELKQIQDGFFYYMIKY